MPEFDGCTGWDVHFRGLAGMLYQAKKKIRNNGSLLN
jgi:hypothetical protein